MSFEDDFLDLMPHSVVVNAYASINGYGSPTYSTVGSTYTARVTYKQKMVRSFDGTEKVSMANAVLNCTGTINPDDKITLPDGTVRPIVNINTISDTGGQHHVSVFFGGYGSVSGG